MIYVLQHGIRSKVGIAFIDCDKFPHTNPFWSHRMREKGIFDDSFRDIHTSCLKKAEKWHVQSCKKSLFFMKYSIQSNFIYQYLSCTKLVDQQGAHTG